MMRFGGYFLGVLAIACTRTAAVTLDDASLPAPDVIVAQAIPIVDASVEDSSIIDSSIIDAADARAAPAPGLTSWSTSGNSVELLGPLDPSTTIKGPQDTVTVSVGGPTVGNVERLVAGLRPGGRACYRRELARDPTLSGKVTYAITLDPSGAVTSVTEKQGGTIDAQVSQCLQAKIKKAVFDPGSSPSFETTWTFSVKRP